LTGFCVDRILQATIYKIVAMKKYSKKVVHSPIENTLQVIGSKWTVLVLRELFGGTKRFGEIEKLLSGISPRTLSLRLASLEEFGIVERKVYPEVPPRVEYKLSALGKSLEPVLKVMNTWGANFAKK
jgi:DNA-binding HxlR family transcriptional regulator